MAWVDYLLVEDLVVELLPSKLPPVRGILEVLTNNNTPSYCNTFPLLVGLIAFPTLNPKLSPSSRFDPKLPFRFLSTDQPNYPIPLASTSRLNAKNAHTGRPSCSQNRILPRFYKQIHL